MIKVKSIKGTPEYIPEDILGSHCDGESFYFFHTKDEVTTNREKSDNEGGEIIDEPIKIDASILDISKLTGDQIEELKLKLGLNK